MNTNDYRQSAIKLLNMLRQTNYVPNNVVSPFTQADEDIIDAIVMERNAAGKYKCSGGRNYCRL